MVRVTTKPALLASFVLSLLAILSCTANDLSTGEIRQSIIECNGSSVGQLCDTDDNPCTQEQCVLVGQNVQCQSTGIASDGTPCLSDNQPCTADLCQAGVCLHTPLAQDTLCEDSLFCISGSTCDAQGLCSGGVPTCDDSNPCTMDVCDEIQQACSAAPIAAGTVCDDFSQCSTASSCDGAGACVGSAFLNCNDNNPCTADHCDSELGCVALAEPVGTLCNDGFFCTVNEACTSEGICQGTANCGDSNPCTVDSCDEPTASCTNLLSPTQQCNDGNECTTTDSCSAFGNCSGTPVADGTSCGSAGGCVTAGNCQGGACLGGVPRPDGTACNDNNACTQSDSCIAGNCDGAAMGCSDQDSCTADGCDEVTGCFHEVISGCAPDRDAGPLDAGPFDGGPFDGGDWDAGPLAADAGGSGSDASSQGGILGGGGCNSARSSSPLGGVVFILLVFFLLLPLKTRRHKHLKSLLAAVLLSASYSSSSRAQGFDSEIFRPGASSSAYLSQPSAQVLPSWTVNLGVAMNLAKNPLVLRSAETGAALSDGVVVARRGSSALSVALGVARRFEIGLVLPLLLSQSSQANMSGAVADLGRAGLGDLRLTLKASLWRLNHIQVTAALDTSAPLGDSQALYGDGGMTAAPQLIAGWSRGRSSLALNLGVRLREKAIVSNLAVGNELIVGAGAQFQVTERRLWLLGEIYASRGLREATAENSPAEALGGVRIALWGPYQLQAAIGMGIGRGYGTPSLRGILGFFYRPQAASPESPLMSAKPVPVQPTVANKPRPPLATEQLPVDSDEDGIMDRSDSCPQQPEDPDGFQDQDGCPDPDNDQDGIPDVDDSCPLQAEIVNGIQDEDGCPDEGIITMVEDRVVLEERVLFDKNRARVKHRGRKALRAIITLYKQHPEWGAMSVEGHADTRGPAQYNLELSRRRADRVRYAMIDLGMPASKIVSKGFGETAPLVSGKSEEAMQKNRRVEFVIRNFREEVQERILLPAIPVAPEKAPETTSSSDTRQLP